MVNVVGNANGDNRVGISPGAEEGKGVGREGGERVYRVNNFPKRRANQIMFGGVGHLRVRLQRAIVITSKNAIK